MPPIFSFLFFNIILNSMKDNIEDILRLADDYKLQGKLLKAIALYESLLEKVKDFELSQWLRITLADLYLWIKNYEKAKELLKESIFCLLYTSPSPRD